MRLEERGLDTDGSKQAMLNALRENGSSMVEMGGREK